MSVEPFAIHAITLPDGGAIGLCRMPGRSGALEADVSTILAWRPAIVVSLTEAHEGAAHSAIAIGQRLAAQGVAHRHFPIADFAIPANEAQTWELLTTDLHRELNYGNRVLLHCMGGCGRSGMIALRLMVERGGTAHAALDRLRAVRPCAVETEAQMAWAAAGHHHQPAVRPK